MDIVSSLRTFSDLALSNRDRYISDLTPEVINDCRHVLTYGSQNAANFKRTLGMVRPLVDEYSVVYGLYYYSTKPDYSTTPEMNPTQDDIMRVNGLILHTACNMSDKVPQIATYLENNGITGAITVEEEEE
ncbi:hypothetical protein BGZ99_003346, partial [Dissophora globulifera]